MLKNKKIVENKLKALYNSSFPKFAFVPEKAYSDGKSSVKGLVVDLQDVIQFDIKVKDPILAYEYDYKVVNDNLDDCVNDIEKILCEELKKRNESK